MIARDICWLVVVGVVVGGIVAGIIYFLTLPKKEEKSELRRTAERAQVAVVAVLCKAALEKMYDEACRGNLFGSIIIPSNHQLTPEMKKQIQDHLKSEGIEASIEDGMMFLRLL